MKSHYVTHPSYESDSTDNRNKKESNFKKEKTYSHFDRPLAAIVLNRTFIKASKSKCCL